jgi:hypothetical protein
MVKGMERVRKFYLSCLDLGDPFDWRRSNVITPFDGVKATLQWKSQDPLCSESMDLASGVIGGRTLFSSLLFLFKEMSPYSSFQLPNKCTGELY